MPDTDNSQIVLFKVNEKEVVTGIILLWPTTVWIDNSVVQAAIAV